MCTVRNEQGTVHWYHYLVRWRYSWSVMLGSLRFVILLCTFISGSQSSVDQQTHPQRNSCLPALFIPPVKDACLEAQRWPRCSVFALPSVSPRSRVFRVVTQAESRVEVVERDDIDVCATEIRALRTLRCRYRCTSVFGPRQTATRSHLLCC